MCVVKKQKKENYESNLKEQKLRSGRGGALYTFACRSYYLLTVF